MATVIPASFQRGQLTIALFLLFLTCATAQYNTENLAPAFDSESEQRFNCEKLRLYPIIANATFQQANSTVGQVVPLNKALQDGRLKINEHKDGAQVNTLQAVNTSQDTVYLMQGEVVVGGQQDRMLAKDVLIPPGATMDLAAFCVEHGRWSENGTGQQFNSTIGTVGQDVRKAAAVEGEQDKVWNEVAEDIATNKTETSSGSYAHLMQDKEFQDARARYRERLKDLPASTNGIVGVIAVSGNKVIGCDVFATVDLFKQAYPQLIDAYIAEALNNGGAVTMSGDEVNRYFTTLFSDEEKLEEKAKGNGYLFKAKDRTFRVSMF
jgi:hypothetical protein